MDDLIEKLKGHLKFAPGIPLNDPICIWNDAIITAIVTAKEHANKHSKTHVCEYQDIWQAGVRSCKKCFQVERTKTPE